jgi:hypothetical protein
LPLFTLLISVTTRHGREWLGTDLSSAPVSSVSPNAPACWPEPWDAQRAGERFRLVVEVPEELP